MTEVPHFTNRQIKYITCVIALGIISPNGKNISEMGFGDILMEIVLSVLPIIAT